MRVFRGRGVTISRSGFNNRIDQLGAPLLSHWPLTESAEPFSDRKNIAPMTVAAGSVQIVGRSLVSGDSPNRCLGFNGAAGLVAQGMPQWDVETGSMGIMIQLDTVAAKQVLINRGSGGVVSGAMSIEVLAGGQVRMWRYDENAVLRELLSDPALVSPGDAHLYVLTWGPAGLLGYVDSATPFDSLVETAWVPDETFASEVYVMQWPTGIGRGDGLASHAFLSGRQMAGADIAELAAYRQNVAWLEDIDAGTVPISTTKVIPVKSGGWHGKAPIVPLVVADPASGTATEVGETIEYTAPGGTGADPFTLNFTDANGQTSPTVNVSITVAAAGATSLIGSWPLSETSGIDFADATGSNDAQLSVPPWIDESTHVLDRPGIVVTNDHALEVSNGGPVIPMDPSYRQADMSLVLYVDPHGELRGCQYWDETAEAWGREYLAFCDDGSTPGSFAIYRRRNGAAGLSGISGTKEWRLGGYVRNAAGTAVYFGPGLAGISGALLPVITAKRIVITLSETNGAALYLDDAAAATLPAVTVGWTALTQAISIGSSPDEGYIHDRSPFWGRVDQIEVWQGALDLTEVQALPAATTPARRWKPPADFVGSAPDVNVATHAYDLQAAINAAHAAGGYVFQDAADNTLCLTKQNNSSPIAMRNNCKGLIGVRMQRIPGNPTAGPRMLVIGTGGTVPGGQLTSGFGDPFAATGGYQVMGCYFDGVARNQSWAAIPGQGTTYYGFNPLSVQFAHCIQTGANAPVTVTVSYCDFYDNIGDGVSLSERTRCYAESNRFYGCFRGPYIENDLVDIWLSVKRCEMHNDGRLIGSRNDNGCGLCDFEPFQPSASTRNRHRMRDCWSEGDLDDKNYQRAPHKSESHYYSCHMTGAALALQPYRATGEGGGDSTREPVDSVILQRCTISYWHPGGEDGGNFPIEQFRGFAPGSSGLGALIDHVVLLANGAPYCYHNSGFEIPANDSNKISRITYTASPATGRIMTIRRMLVRSRRLPASMTQANKRAIVCQNNTLLGTSRTIRIEGLDIAAEFSAIPFNWGGARVEYRDVVHAGFPSDPTPWEQAGQEVPI